MERTVTITVGGKKVKLNAFVKETTINVVTGLLKALRDVNADEDITITIGRP